MLIPPELTSGSWSIFPFLFTYKSFLLLWKSTINIRYYPLKGYNMIYLATSPFISNIAISFIAVNLTVICFKRETERESIRLATDTFCTSHPSPHSTERAVSGAGWGVTAAPPPAKLPCGCQGASHIWDFTYPMLQKATVGITPACSRTFAAQARLDSAGVGSCKMPWLSPAVAPQAVTIPAACPWQRIVES